MVPSIPIIPSTKKSWDVHWEYDHKARFGVNGTWCWESKRSQQYFLFGGKFLIGQKNATSSGDGGGGVRWWYAWWKARFLISIHPQKMTTHTRGGWGGIHTWHTHKMEGHTENHCCFISWQNTCKDMGGMYFILGLYWQYRQSHPSSWHPGKCISLWRHGMKKRTFISSPW